jgi:hypothetical protein
MRYLLSQSQRVRLVQPAFAHLTIRPPQRQMGVLLPSLSGRFLKPYDQNGGANDRPQ